MNLNKEIVKFRSSPDYYHDEVTDLKNNTERIIDWDDERFHILELMRLRNEFGFIQISITESTTHVYFKRKIRHICKWDEIMIITWEEN